MERRIGIEYIKVFVDYQDGQTACICKRSKKMCNKQCTPEIVERDKYRGWQDTFVVDKYGKTRVR